MLVYREEETFLDRLAAVFRSQAHSRSGELMVMRRTPMLYDF